MEVATRRIVVALCFFSIPTVVGALTCYECWHNTYSTDAYHGTVDYMNELAKSWNDDNCKGNGNFTAIGAARNTSGTCEAEVKCGRGHLQITVSIEGKWIENDFWISNCINKDSDDGKALGCTSKMDDINRGGWLTDLGMVSGEGVYCTCGTNNCNHANHVVTLATSTLVVALLAAGWLRWSIMGAH